MSIQKEHFGDLSDGRPVERYRLSGISGIQVELISYGATVTKLLVPDREGSLGEVVLGYDSLEEYEKGTKFFGAAIGRYANRIAGGSFSLNGKEYHLTRNEASGATLHGGVGFDRKAWEALACEDGEEPSITFGYLSPDGEEGFPGNLEVRITYTLIRDNSLRVAYWARPDQDTPINLTNHSYFNLTGNAGNTVLDHRLSIAADFFTPTSPDGIPTGELWPVKGTPMDFTEGKRVGQEISSSYPQVSAARGYDHNYVLRSNRGEQPAALVYDPGSGRSLAVYTSEPGMQLYTANYLDGTDIGKGGIPLQAYCAFCLETQHFPDSVHQPQFPSAFYRAGEIFRSETEYCFSVDRIPGHKK